MAVSLLYFIHEKINEKEITNLSSELKNLLENVNLFSKTYDNNLLIYIL